VTRTQACGGVRRELGVYVLGAIAPADRPAVDSHLACCAACRDELAGLAGLPALLGRVPADDVDRLVLGAGDVARDDRPLEPGPAFRQRRHRQENLDEEQP